VSDPLAERKIGPLLATGLVAGNIVGSGVFLLPATLGAIGSISVIGWVLATLGAFVTTAVFAALGRISASLDGMVGYAGEGLGRFFGFSIALVYWMGAWVGTVAMAVAVAGYFAVFAPTLAHPLPLAMTAVAAIWLFTLVNLVGAKAAARFSGFSLVAGLAPILAVGLLGWIWFDPKVFAASWNVSGHPAGSAVRLSMISIFWAYTGFESAAVASAVVRDPERNVPFSTFAGTAIAALVYIAASVALMGLAPARDLAGSSAPFALAAAKALGPLAASLVAACALIKTSGTLNGWILVVAEAARAGADAHLFGGRLAAAGRGRVPARILIAMATVMSVVVLASVSPTLGRQFQILIDVSTVWTIIPYMICCAALWRLARPLPAAARRAMRAASLTAFAFNAWLVSTGDAVTLWLTLALVAVTAALGLALALRRRPAGAQIG
jgi:arginine:agmatine antiporter